MRQSSYERGAATRWVGRCRLALFVADSVYVYRLCLCASLSRRQVKLGVEVLLTRAAQDIADLEGKIKTADATLAGPASKFTAVPLADKAGSAAREEAKLARVLDARSNALRRAQQCLGAATAEHHRAQGEVLAATDQVQTLRQVCAPEHADASLSCVIC